MMVNLMTPVCPGPLAAKQAQIISRPPPCLTAEIKRLNLHALFAFSQGDADIMSNLVLLNYFKMNDTAMA